MVEGRRLRASGEFQGPVAKSVAGAINISNDYGIVGVKIWSGEETDSANAHEGHLRLRSAEPGLYVEPGLFSRSDYFFIRGASPACVNWPVRRFVSCSNWPLVCPAAFLPRVFRFHPSAPFSRSPRQDVWS